METTTVKEDEAIDALLATACGRLSDAAALVNRMRHMAKSGNMYAYWSTCLNVADTLSGCSEMIRQAHAILAPEDALVSHGQEV